MLKIWISAFIPETVAGYTTLIQRGTYKGKTAIPLPLVARPVNWKPINAGYLTDQRTFNDSQSASHRMQSGAEIEIEPVLKLKRVWHTSSGTTEVDTKSGDHLGFAIADMSRCSLVDVTPAGSKADTMSLLLKAAAGDPLVNFAADIDYVGTFNIVKNYSGKKIYVSFSGKVDKFPAYDCYANLGNKTQELFKLNPPAGNTVVDLLGPAGTSVSGSAIFS